MKTIDNKKKLGQYFTETRVATLLAYLSHKKEYKRIIDPMCGIGDMLAAYSKLSQNSIDCTGIEIDESVFPELKKKIASNNFLKSKFNLINSNAFAENTLSLFQDSRFDLVITNPPYVRYQTMSSVEDDILINAKNIRKNILQFISNFSFEDITDRKYFDWIVKSYSGLSDLAVPSWILCALLTKIGGTLAIVVPDTWLNRDYSDIVQYILFRWFRIKYVVEDINSCWFKDAQVKTILIVAERIERKKSILSWENEFYFHIPLIEDYQTDKSLIGQLFENSATPEVDLIKALDNNIGLCERLKVSNVSILKRARSLLFKAKKTKWISQIEKMPLDEEDNYQVMLPPVLHEWLGSNSSISFTNLDYYGVRVGQGLRTGANKFFYVDIVDESSDDWIVAPNGIFNHKKLAIPKSCISKALRKQDELDDIYELDSKSLTGGVLVFRNIITHNDFERLKTSSSTLQTHFIKFSEELSSFITKTASLNIGTEDKPRFLPNLSAVAPNVRAWNPSKPSVLPRFWYMLPELKERHIPMLFIPRINNNSPRTYLNSTDECVIDANFSTLWIDTPEILDRFSLLALLNSTFCTCIMELMATVMGGGALKLEATHIKNLPIPHIEKNNRKKLSSLGRKLCDSTQDFSKVIKAIDIELIDNIMKFPNGKDRIQELNELKKLKTSQRKRK